jgi:hypothetical protein
MWDFYVIFFVEVYAILVTSIIIHLETKYLLFCSLFLLMRILGTLSPLVSSMEAISPLLEAEVQKVDVE